MVRSTAVCVIAFLWALCHAADIEEDSKVSVAVGGDGGLGLLQASSMVGKQASDSVKDDVEGSEIDSEPRSWLDDESAFDEELEQFEVLAHADSPRREGPLDHDVMAKMHALTSQEEENAVGGYIFDGDGTNRNPNQRCFIRNQGADKTKMPDNIENSVVDAQEQLNNDGTNRAQWAKCLPPPMYTLLSIASFAEGDIYNGRYEKRMKNATDFYATLKWLHNEACSHIRLRLVHPDMLKAIRDEVNFREKTGTGVAIRDEVMKIINIIVQQHRSRSKTINPANSKVFHTLKTAVPNMQQALRVAEHADLMTVASGYGRRRNACKATAGEMLEAISKEIMNFDIGKLEKFLDERPGPLDDYMTGTASRGLGEPTIGTDGIPDALKNYGRCGEPLFDFAGYTLWTLSLSLDKKGKITILSRDGWVSAEAIEKKAVTHPLKLLLPPDAFEVETKTTTYQDDLFSQGNLACGNRADGVWTLVSYDRNAQDNKVTATQEEGYFCVWMLNDLIHLPENQRAGFSNTEFIAESPEEMARVMNGEAAGYRKYFPGPNEKYKYYHCHYSPTNSGAARVHSFQHQAERHYPGGVRQYCNCDWRRMAMIVSRCDCTLDAKANGGCRRVEMEMLNEHTQVDLWRKDGKKTTPARIVMVHGDLAEGKITSYTYQNNRRRREPDNKNIYQEDTGRVRQTTNGNGGNNVVCSVDENGNADQNNVRTYRRKGNLQALAKLDSSDNFLGENQDCTGSLNEVNQGTARVCGAGLKCTAVGNRRRGPNDGQPQQAQCRKSGNANQNHIKRTFFADMNGNGKMDYPQCRRRRANRNQKSPCEGDLSSVKSHFHKNDFPIRDIYADAANNAGTTYSPAGGVNTEFMTDDGEPCDALRMGKNCKPADAGWRREGALIELLSKFCDTPASLYQVPTDELGNVPADFGAVTYPMPICNPWKGVNCTNFRAKARADFGARGKGSWLQCQTKSCREGTKPSAAQGVFNENVDKYVYSKSPADAYSRPWYPMIGGDSSGQKPTAVNAKWIRKGTKASGIFNQDILMNHWSNSNPGARYAKQLVEQDGTRNDGVTCLNGKYIYARKESKFGGPRPIVSTVREAFNRNGPVSNGQWACRYLGVHCNANNCNNNGNGEVPGPFVVPKITTTTTTRAF